MSSRSAWSGSAPLSAIPLVSRRYVEIGAYGAGSLCPGRQCGRGRVHRLVPAAEQRRPLLTAIVGEREGQVAFGGDVCDEGPQPAEERVIG
jgi:hypothetical protein